MTNHQDAVLTLRELEVGYRRPILPPISATISVAEIWGIVGPNGAGKSTLLKTIVGLLPPLGGSITWANRRIGYVPQRATVDPMMPQRVVDFVAMGFDSQSSVWNPFFRRNIQDRLGEILEETSLTDHKNTAYANLSEGERQRALIGAALAVEPSILVLDEPTSSMDQENERQILELISSIVTHRQIPVVMVSHQLRTFLPYATNLILVDSGSHSVTIGRRDDVLATESMHQTFGSFTDLDAPHDLRRKASR